ncbi:uncharacterized protein IL334_004606 [Kwoniella shivajii]|uniref:Calpain catalytic domain-containing protein n=1 Tax=Kwoniella shivajii TaxID=564305 RepID=A0ABZ1D268_9TREE|nr:hypothetical protein IL334_004606 [Kwoniella shivajii]
MKGLLTILLGILPILIASVSSAPISESETLEKRGVAPIWYETGPRVQDVIQLKVLNCWWAACSLAVLMSSQKWIEQLVRTGNGTSIIGIASPSDSTSQVTVWNPNSGQQETFTADHNLISQTEDHPDGNWWHDALGQGAKALGKTDSVNGILSGENPDFDPNSGSAKTGLKILTGHDTAFKLKEEIDIGTFFWYCQQAGERHTPVIFNTVPKEDMGTTEPQLGHDHDYAVYNGTENSDGTKTIWARNSWGYTDGFTLEEVYQNSHQLIFLQGLVSLGDGPFDVGNHTGGSGNTTTGTNSTSTASSTSPSSSSASTNGTDSTSSGATPSTSSTSPGSSSAITTPLSNPLRSTETTSTAATSVSAQSSATQDPSASATAAPGSSSGPGNGGTTSPWSWTSLLPGWSTTYPATKVSRATNV